MTISVDCPECGQTYKVGDDKAGRKMKCRDCGNVVAIPAAGGKKKQAAAADDEFGGASLPPRVARKKSGADAGAKSATKPGKKKSGGGKTSKKWTANKAVLISLIATAVAGLGGVIWGVIAVIGRDAPAPIQSPAEAPPDPAAAAPTQPPAEPATPPAAPALPTTHTAFLSDRTIGAVVLRPSRILASPLLKGLPVDQFLTSIREEFPFDLRTFEELGIVIQAPAAAGQEPELVAVVRFKEPTDVLKLLREKATPNVRIDAAKVDGRDGANVVEVVADPANPSAPGTAGSRLVTVLPTGDRAAILAASPQTLEASLQAARSATTASGTGAVADRLRSIAGERDLIVVAFPSGRPDLIDQATATAAMTSPIPVPDGLGELAKGVFLTSIAIDLSGPELLNVGTQAIDSASADQIEETMRSGERKGKELYALGRGTLQEKLPQPGMLEQIDRLMDGLKVTRTGTTVSLTFAGSEKLPELVTALMPVVGEMMAKAGPPASEPVGGVELIPEPWERDLTWIASRPAPAGSIPAWESRGEVEIAADRPDKPIVSLRLVKVTPTDLVQISQLKSLESLEIFLTDPQAPGAIRNDVKSLSPLTSLTKLRRLDVIGYAPTAQDLEGFAALPDLEVLIFRHEQHRQWPAVTAVPKGAFAKLIAFRVYDPEGTGHEFLPLLANCPKLKWIDVKGTSITADAAIALHRAHPTARIKLRDEVRDATKAKGVTIPEFPGELGFE